MSPNATIQCRLMVPVEQGKIFSTTDSMARVSINLMNAAKLKTEHTSSLEDVNMAVIGKGIGRVISTDYEVL